MEYIEIGICVAATIVVGVILYLKMKKRKDIPSDVIGIINSSAVKEKDELVETDSANKLVIQMEMLPAEAIEDAAKLVEITDSKVLAHVNNLVPGLHRLEMLLTMLHRLFKQQMVRCYIELLSLQEQN